MEEHSMVRSVEIAHAVLEGENSLDDLMACFLSDDLKLAQRASWAVTKVADSDVTLLVPYFGAMAENLNKQVHDAVKRNTVRIWHLAIIPEDQSGIVYEICFKFLLSMTEPVAIRIFSMTTCTNIAVRHPELAAELADVIRDHMPHGTAGFKSRGRKELKRLERI